MNRAPELSDNAADGGELVQEEMWLLGQPPLQKFLDFAEDNLATPARRSSLVDEWSTASACYEELEKREARIADRLPCMPLDASLQLLADEVMAHPRYRLTFDSLPTRIAMVELGRMVVCQNHVTRTFVERVMARLGAGMDPETLFHACLPLEQDAAPVRMRRVGSRRYVFTSDSTDFRYHESVLLRPEQLVGHDSFGNVAAAVGLIVGYSSNFLNALCDVDSGRLLLNNGYHRACALQELGVKFAPCIVQDVSNRDELDIVAKSIVANDPGYFFNAPRPPLLKDFMDPRICKRLRVKKGSRVIEVNFEVKDYFVHD